MIRAPDLPDSDWTEEESRPYQIGLLATAESDPEEEALWETTVGDGLDDPDGFPQTSP